MGSKKIAAAVVAMALLAGCTMRTQAPRGTTAYDFSERDAYGQSFAASPTYAGQDTSWTTTAPARAVGGLWLEKAEGAAPAKAKGGEEGDSGKFGAPLPSQESAEVARPAPARPAPRAPSTPVQRAQSPSSPGAGSSSR
jgi:hypothetical protein